MLKNKTASYSLSPDYWNLAIWMWWHKSSHTCVELTQAGVSTTP